MLGLCARARGLVSGAYAVEQGVRRGKVGLVLADAALSPASQKEFSAKCSRAHIPLVYTQPEGMLGHVIGKEEIKLVGIVHTGFLHRVLDLMEHSTGCTEV